MSSIDQRIVQMQFDNKQFEAGIASTLSSLDKLNQGLKLKGASDGLNNVSAAAKGFSLAGIANGVDSIANKFRTLSLVGIEALSHITNKIVDTGIEMVKSFTIDPIMEGFHNYETQINAVQTIMANTGLKGASGLAQVNKVLAELNTYANQTVYNFSDMAKNIGTFTAAGVKLDVATSSIKGIANLAALSGASAEQASGAMYQLSQAIAAGSVKLQDWNSVVNAGLGGKVFQTALVNTARNSGVAIDSIIKKAGSFRESLQKGWLTSDILTKTLTQFTGDLSLKQIEAMGYTKQQAEQIYQMGQTALQSATKIKTMSQLTQALREEVGTAYAAIFKTLFGDIGQATDLFSNIHNVAENALTGPIYALNNVLEGWSKLGGRTALIDGLTAGFKALGQIIGTIKAAFREVFPPETAKGLYDMTVSFRDFMEKLKMGGQTLDELKRTFAGAFAVIKIGWDIVSALAKAIFGLVGNVSQGSGGILKFTANIGDFLVKLEAAINKSQIFTKFFTDIAAVISIPIQLLEHLGKAIGELFGKFDGNKASKGLNDAANAMGKVSSAGNVALVIWNAIATVLRPVGNAIKSITDTVKGFFHNLGTGGSTTSQGFWSILAFLQTLLAGGFLVTLTRFMNFFQSRGGSNPAATLIKQLTEPFEQLTKTLKTMQTTLQAATLLEIAAAVAILALAMHEIAGLNAAQLERSGAAITAMMGQLIGSLILFQKFVGTAGFIKLPFMMASLLLFAGAIDILASAVLKLAKLNWNDLGKGLSGLAGIMVILAGGIKLIGNPKGLVLTGFGLTEIAGAIGGLVVAVSALSGLGWSGLAKGLLGLAGILGTLILFTKFADASNAGAIRSVGLILLATAIKILVSAVKDFSAISWEGISKGLTGVATLLGALALYTKFSDANKAGLLQSAGMIALATAIKILVSAVKDFAGMSWQNIAKGLVGVGTLLAGLTLFTKFSDANKAGLIQGAGIILIAAGIKILASAVKDFAAISWEGISKGLISIGVGLGVFALALKAIPPSSIISAAGVAIVAGSLLLIANAMSKMASISWEGIAKGLLSMSIALAAIAVALDGLPPSSVLSAAAIFIVAASLGKIADALAKMGGISWEGIVKSLILLGGSLVIIAGAMAIMPEALPGAAALYVVSKALQALVPALQGMAAISWEGIAKDLVLLAGAFIVIAAGGVLLEAAVPGLLGFGAAVVLVGAGVYLAGSGVALFAAGLKALSEEIKGVGDSLSKDGPSLVKALEVILDSMISAVAKETPKIINLFFTMIGDMLTALQKYAPKFTVAAFNIMIAILNGIASKLPALITAATNVVVAFISGISANMGRVLQAGASMIINFINQLAATIRGNSKALGAAGGNLATSIIEGMVTGLASGLGSVIQAAKNVANSAISAAKKALGINSPSKEFIKIGQSVNEGFYKGLTTGNAKDVDKAFQSLRDQLATTINSNDNQINSLEQKLKRLERARHGNRAEISATKQELSTLLSEHKKEIAAYDEVTKGLNKQHAALDAVDKKYADVTARLNAANQTLANAIKTRDDYNKQITDAFNKDPQFSASTTLATYEAGLSQQIEKTKEFANVMARLRKEGLSDGAYKEFLSEGIAALPMAQQLLDAGASGVKTINDQYAQLDTAATALGKSASQDLYQAAVDSAQGLVDGLKKQQAALEKQMEALADAMVNAIKKKLGIHSPSKVFAEVGGFSAQGLAAGLDEMSGIVEKSAAAVGQKAIDSLSKSLTDISTVVTKNMDVKPTITPVLDLSSVKKSASQIGSMLATQPLSVQSSFVKAMNAAATYTAPGQAIAAAQTAPAVKPAVTFVQNNNSPKALAPADIYRQTKNQLSQARGYLVYQNGGSQP
jgi:tape measure domain-containing protein